MYFAFSANEQLRRRQRLLLKSAAQRIFQLLSTSTILQNNYVKTNNAKCIDAQKPTHFNAVGTRVIS